MENIIDNSLQEATEMVANYKEKHGSIDAKFNIELQLMYNSDKGENIEREMIDLLEIMQ
ncbi:MAG: hypothetical protein L3J34_09970 [Flavobacteriaceae bacterium]|nr:hypothetical protein [Flavobacteriaceae bacterium]